MNVTDWVTGFLVTVWMLSALPLAFTIAKIAATKGYSSKEWFGWGVLCWVFALLLILAKPVTGDDGYVGRH